MSAAQRRKGQVGEREVAKEIHDLLGFDVRRRVRQHDGDSDLVGVPGWSIEIKNHRTVTRGLLKLWWQQTFLQAGPLLPVLIYKRGPGWWRAMYYSPRVFATIEAELPVWADEVRNSLPVDPVT
jgi:hypothetical protein